MYQKYRKKSMRIFLLSLCLLLVSGAVIIGVVYYKSHKNADGSTDNAQESDNTKKARITAESEIDTKTEDNRGRTEVHEEQHTRPDDTAADTALQQTNGRAAAYLYELKVMNGYLDIYYYHTPQLFLHTGIPYRTLTVSQKQELEHGKYFQSEEELYGYLESCTS